MSSERTKITIALGGFVVAVIGGTAALVRALSDEAPAVASTSGAAATVARSPPSPNAAPNALQGAVATPPRPLPAAPTTATTPMEERLAENPYAAKGLEPRDGYTLSVPLVKVPQPNGSYDWAPKAMKGAGPPADEMQKKFRAEGRNFGWSGGYPLPPNWDHETETEAIGIERFDKLPPSIVNGTATGSMMRTAPPPDLPKGAGTKEGGPVHK